MSFAFASNCDVSIFLDLKSSKSSSAQEQDLLSPYSRKQLENNTSRAAPMLSSTVPTALTSSFQTPLTSSNMSNVQKDLTGSASSLPKQGMKATAEVSRRLSAGSSCHLSSSTSTPVLKRKVVNVAVQKTPEELELAKQKRRQAILEALSAMPQSDSKTAGDKRSRPGRSASGPAALGNMPSE